MSHRDVLKNIVKFGKREYNEKKPLSLQILRIKSKSILKRGMLPNLNIKQIHGIFFLVILNYKTFLRIYFFNRDGQLLGGENVDISPILMKKLKKETILEYKLPKQKPTLTINHITTHYREEFKKYLINMNKLFGMTVKLPIIIAHDNLKIQIGRNLGCISNKKKNTLIISSEAYKKEIFEIIALKEIMYLYLRELIILFQDIEDEVIFWHDLAILFTNFYLGNKKNQYFLNIVEKSTNSFLNFKNGDTYNFSYKILEILKKNKEIYSKNEIIVLFKNTFSCLKIFKEYGIKLRYREFANFFFDLCDLFSRKNNIFSERILQKTNYFNFHLIYLNKTLEIDKDSKKDKFLVFIFKILSLKGIEIISISDLLKKIAEFYDDININKEIIDHQKLVNDALLIFIFNYKIKININPDINQNYLEITVNIKNDEEFIFKDFTYKLTWKPKNRIHQISVEDLVKSRDLHAILKRKYTFSIESKGNVTFFINIEFLNPFNNNNQLNKKIKFNKINLEINQ